jgi:GH24 family phage-related lysozyme (muramidase)
MLIMAGITASATKTVFAALKLQMVNSIVSLKSCIISPLVQRVSTRLIFSCVSLGCEKLSWSGWRKSAQDPVP